MMDAHELAQKMLDKYGFFVVTHRSRQPLGIAKKKVVSNRAGITGEITSKIVLVAPASEEDYRNQCQLAGIEVTARGDYKYRAVAE